MKNDAIITPEDKGKIHICKKRVQNVKNDLGVPQITPPQTRKRVKKARKEYKMRKKSVSTNSIDLLLEPDSHLIEIQQGRVIIMKKVSRRTRSTYYWNGTNS